MDYDADTQQHHILEEVYKWDIDAQIPYRWIKAVDVIGEGYIPYDREKTYIAIYPNSSVFFIDIDDTGHQHDVQIEELQKRWSLDALNCDTELTTDNIVKATFEVEKGISYIQVMQTIDINGDLLENIGELIKLVNKIK